MELSADGRILQGFHDEGAILRAGALFKLRDELLDTLAGIIRLAEEVRRGVKGVGGITPEFLAFAR